MIDVGITTFCYHFLHFPAYAASVVGFLSGFFFNFPANRKKVFKHANNDKLSLKAQLLAYMVLCIVNLIVSAVLVQALVNIGVVIAVAKIITTLIIAAENFIIYKTIIFAKKPK